jgi:predicted DNA-binding transcriptional regulator YafY
MPEAPINLNLARVVHRLMTHPRGWHIDEMQRELDIAQRTYRKYREVLQSQFEPLHREDGTSRIREVKEADGRYLRLVGPSILLQETGILARFAGLYLARQMLSFFDGTDVARVFNDLISDIRHRVDDQDLAEHLLRNVDRLFYYVPHAPKDYARHGSVIRLLIECLVYPHQIELDYDPANGARKVTVIEPLTLMSYRSGLYVIARDTQSGVEKTYAVDRIQSARKLGRFEYPGEDEYRPSNRHASAFGIFASAASNHPIRVQLIFRNEKWLHRDLLEREWHHSQQFEVLPDGRLLMTFTVNTLVEVRPWVLGYGDNVEIVNPPPHSNLWLSTDP